MKKFLIILTIIIIVVGVFFFLRKRQLERAGMPARSFRDFFALTSTQKPTGEQPGQENPGVFDPEQENPTQPLTTPIDQPVRSAFGDTPAGTLPSLGGTIVPNSSIGFTDPATGGTLPRGPSIIPPNDNGDSTLPPEPLCRPDDLEIEFTTDEIAQLKALEEEFYTIAPNLRSDQDVAVERGNWSEYRFLNEQFADMTQYCENTVASAGFPENLKRYLRTPFWSDSRATNNRSFVDAYSGDGTEEIDIKNPPSRRPGFIERFFKLNLW